MSVCMMGVSLGALISRAHARANVDMPVVKLRSLDKITARTMVFEANVGSTVKFGSLYIKVRACRKAPEMEKPEAAAFLQIWEINAGKKEEGALSGSVPESSQTQGIAEWVFSGWMFASSPGLSSMDHPIYDVWVLDCLQKKAQDTPPPSPEPAYADEGEIAPDRAPVQPNITP